MKLSSLALTLAISYASAFTVPSSRTAAQSRLYALPTPEESAKALSDYMAKSHEEKIKAIAAAESKKDAEIEALKKEVESLKKGGALATTQQPVLGTVNKSTTEKLAAYQQFMADYIVKAQEEKYRAVKAAEAAMAKKYEDKLLLLGAGAAPAAPKKEAEVAPPSTLKPSEETKLYAQRSAKVEAAAKAGKSRWGDAEVKKAANVVSNGVQTIPSATNKAKATKSDPVLNVAVIDIPPEVTAADHGLRADGGVGGLSLAERVALGSKTSATPNAGAAVTTATSSAAPSLYDKRNAKVSAAGKAGKSRWGQMEVDKATSLAVAALNSSPVTASMPVPAEVSAADHGLRADGGVSGPSLAERVNLGAQLLASK
mmetsp:Transcript_23817/g.36738  ORF Transcript_23817/g.36738 Transcript_23817/m.36738 type:complete len:371 (+) Transcript_23817:63-1175(+)|eukprot:CAMPEP_0196809124 /NCGR_PEP_ID=MMETSP1362-20130617/9094_1 /TAXON_ID=163516 /ORGANISM="Leptocylindrus danicus, Strain CCMP1856" /LENGTH=370 /DNA_ID=CAMNT_0042183707 /DNA_START=30 /DNA_END=1142 /DNA_ORIENTATION=+